MKKHKTIVLKDGEDLIVLVQTTAPSVFDPAAVYGSVTRVYRVICAKSRNSVLELVPLTEPQLVGDKDTRDMIEGRAVDILKV